MGTSNSESKTSHPLSDVVGSGTSTGVDSPTIGGPIVHHLGPIDECPGCGGRDFLIRDLDDFVAWNCLGCGALWRYELGYVWPVAPRSTEGAG